MVVSCGKKKGFKTPGTALVAGAVIYDLEVGEPAFPDENGDTMLRCFQKSGRETIRAGTELPVNLWNGRSSKGGLEKKGKSRRGGNICICGDNLKFTPNWRSWLK